MRDTSRYEKIRKNKEVALEMVTEWLQDLLATNLSPQRRKVVRELLQVAEQNKLGEKEVRDILLKAALGEHQDFPKMVLDLVLQKPRSVRLTECLAYLRLPINQQK